MIMDAMPPNWGDHYWQVGDGPAGHVYHSGRAAYVPTSDTTYKAWAEHRLTSRIPTRAELAVFLRLNHREGYGPAGHQLDLLYQDRLDGGERFKAHVEAVKARFPKA